MTAGDRGTYGLRLLRQPGVRLAMLVIVAVVALAYRALQFVRLTGQIQWGYDFSAYWAAAGRLLHGEPLYFAAQLAGPYSPQQQYLYIYPPPLAAAVTPLAAVFPDYHQAAWVWALIGASIIVASALVLWRWERLADRLPSLAPLGDNAKWLLVAAAFCFPPAIGELVLGNVHLLLLDLLVIAWLGVRWGGRRGELIAGVAVGIAAVIKVFPALILLWFLLTRRYRACAGVLIGAALAAVVALPLTGFEPWTQLPAVLLNLGAPVDTTDTLAPTVWLAPLIGFTAARVAVTLAGLALVAWSATRLGAAPQATAGDYPTGITDETSKPTAPNAATARSFAIAVTVSVLIAPALYHHYLAMLLLPFALALGAGVPLRWLALAYFLMWGGQQPALGDLAFLVNRAAPTAGALVLLAALLVERRGLPDTLGGDAHVRPPLAGEPDARPAGI